jgi:hypothetical protein
MTAAQIIERALRGKRIVVRSPAFPSIEYPMTVEAATVDALHIRIIGRSDSGALFSRILFPSTEIEILNDNIPQTNRR